MHEPEEITATIADYLEAIYNMLDEGKVVIAARVADRMGVSRPTVSATLRRMRSHDLIAIADDHQITLTAHGLDVAHHTIRRHRLAERFLTDVLGLEWHLVHTEAHAFEHGMSPVVEERLMALLGQPLTCPHGNPIPGTPAPRLPENAATLDEVESGTVVMLRITEEGERDLEFLRQLQTNGVTPGTSLRVARHERGQTIVITPTATLALPQKHARTLWVQPTA